MNILYFIPPLLLLGYLTYKNISHGLYVILATVPAFLLRTRIFFIPTTWLELAIYTVAVISIIKHIQNDTLEAHFYHVLHKAKPYVIPITILILSVLVAVLTSENQISAIGILKAWFFDPLLFGIVFLDTCHKKNSRTAFVFYLSIGAWPIIIYGLIEYILGINMLIPGRLDSFFNSPNYAAMYLVPMTILIAGSFAGRPKFGRVYFSVWLAFSLAAIFLTKSFGGWFGLLGGILFLVFFLSKITFKKTAVFGVCLIIATLMMFYFHQKSAAHYNLFWQANSLKTRREVWSNSLMMLKQNPILGIGLADFETDYYNFIIRLPENKQPIEHQVPRPHNIFLNFWLETGLIGLAAFLWIILIFFQQTFKSSGALPVGAAMTALLLHGLIDTPYFKNDLSLLFWFLLVMNINLNCRQKQ
ncbi:MAG: O-antigen ligase family protein [Patescibacteria group bacterium]